MPRLTVGLPVFNAMPFLPQAVESLLAQTYSDFDLLAVDDGSTDGSLDYLHSVSDRRLSVVTQPNQGLSATLNYMLSNGSSPWHVRHDADDIAYPDRLMHVADAVCSHPTAGMFYTLADQIPHAPGRKEFRTTRADPEALRAITRSGYLLAICHPTAVLNVEKTLALGGYRTHLLASQDQDLWWRMALTYDVRLIDRITLDYRMTASGLSNASLVRQVTESLYVQYELISGLWQLPARPLDAVRETLESMIDPAVESSRSRLRAAAIAFGERSYPAAALQAVRAAAVAPGYIVSRLTSRAARASAPAVTGVDPMQFVTRYSSLWQSNGS